MMKKRISEITMLTCLMLGGIVNAQEFYTCVPKKSWWKDTIKESVPENKVNLSDIVQELKDLKNNIPSASDIANAVKETIPTPTPQKNWELIKSVNLNNYGNSIKLEPGNYKFVFKTKDKKAIQNIVNSSVTAELRLIGYYTHWCQSATSWLRDFLNGYDKKNLFYLRKDNFANCKQHGGPAQVSALVLDNIALFTYECECNKSENIFIDSTLEIYKKNDD